MANIIEINSVTKRYKNGDQKTSAVKNVSYSLPKGESLAIIGPSGSGKSTLLNLLGGLDKPTEGGVKIDNSELNKLNDNELSKFRNRVIGFVFQFFNLQEYLTAQENVMIPMLIAGEKQSHAKHQAEELLKQVGLSERKNYYPKQLSGGEMQRVAVARSLANKPKILLADEPTANLDKASAEKVLDIFDDIAKTGVSVVVITHDHNVSDRFKNVLKLKNGEVE
ncbi:MAG: ABC transporter ATP-binding protein [Candidatus Dojkabacteria bacterium]